jgi:hypothetical protein
MNARYQGRSNSSGVGNAERIAGVGLVAAHAQKLTELAGLVEFDRVPKLLELARESGPDPFDVGDPASVLLPGSAAPQIAPLAIQSCRNRVSEGGG